uniref:Uncharacterized protein n=1 Tax=Salix viminalis TaxID=40686 RepID=A0A6N2NIR1_SALVM
MDETLGNNSSQNNERSLWLGSIMREATKDKNNQPLSPKIPRVPHKLRNENEECYRPLVVSIGPYHYPGRDNTLREVETLKVPMARQFILDSGKDIELIYSELEKVIQTARKFYNEIDIIGFDDEQFARMMFLDGCFILQFISCVTDHNYENLEMSDRQVAGVKRDLLLLENQVPFPVLQSLMRLRLIVTVKKSEASASGYNWQLKSAQQPAHLLELLHSLFICSHKSKVKSSPRRYGHCLSYLVTCCKKIIPAKPEPVVARESRGHYLYYSAKNLKKVGIHFMPSQTSGLMDVKFKSSFFYGTVNLPTLSIDVSTKPLLFNLVAYDTSAALHQLPVTSYICFMDSLIDHANDVKELRSKGIIVNFLGSDQQVADLFNDMGSSLEPDTSAYNDVKREINKQCESTLKKWVAEWRQTYFHSPWAFIAYAAAAGGLALTAAETGLSIQYLYGKVAEVATDARRYYAEDSTDEFDDEKPEDLKMPGHHITLTHSCTSSSTRVIQGNDRRIISRRSSDWYSYRFAKDLLKVGIRFRPNWTNAYSDVEFQSSEVADLFNHMSRNLVPNPYAYGDVKRRIELNCKSIIKKGASELLQTYSAFLGALSHLVLQL